MNLKILTIILFAVVTVGVQAQELSKSEKKALKKEIRKLLKDPQKYQQLKENIEAKDLLVKEQVDGMTKLSKEKNLIQNQLNVARDSIGLYESKIETIRTTNTNLSCKDDSGMKYRVQIGLYREFDISSFLKEIKVTSFEMIDDMYRYTIGNFSTEQEAEEFKLAIRKMGIEGAFVSYYLDGARVPK